MLARCADHLNKLNLLSFPIVMVLSPERISAISKTQKANKQKHVAAPAWGGLLDVFFTVALPGVKAPFETGTKKDQGVVLPKSVAI